LIIHDIGMIWRHRWENVVWHFWQPIDLFQNLLLLWRICWFMTQPPVLWMFDGIMQKEVLASIKCFMDLLLEVQKKW